MIVILNNFHNKMNIILLSIWVKILLITCLCVYYNRIILNKYLESVTPTQPKTNSKCQYQNIPTAELSSLQKCNNISGHQTYIYSVGGVKYQVSPTEQFYSKICTGFCIDGLTPIQTCKKEANQKLMEQCETLLKPDSNCNSGSKPLVNVHDGKTSSYYYAVSPINSLTTCS